MRFAICPFHVSKASRLPRKSEARSYKVLHLSRKIILANLKIPRSKIQPLSGNQRLTSEHLWWTCLLYCACHGSSSNLPRLPMLLKVRQTSLFLTFGKVQNPLRRTTSEHPKVVRTCHLFRFWLRHVLASQRRALLRHLNCQKWSGADVLCTFWLGNVLCATMERISSTSQLPKALRHWSVLYISPWKCASRHNGVQFFISHLATWLCTRRFSEPTFRPSGHKSLENTVSHNFSTFSRTCIFFLLTLSLLWSSLFCSYLLWLFPPLLFHLPILSEVWLPNFLR